MHQREISDEANAPKSAHVADPFLQPFLQASYDPAEYLNSKLPSLNTVGTAPAGTRDGVNLAQLYTQAQTLISQLSAHTTRLTTTLTQLTDEILRNGSRLAYEVEVLRGETLLLSENLTDTLHDDIVKFVPAGLETESQNVAGKDLETEQDATCMQTTIVQVASSEKSSLSTAEVPFIERLRTLTLVRTRLEMVIKTFGEAMAWTLPPSEVSVASSFISLSAPESGSEAYSIEEKGQQDLKNLRNEISTLLNRGDPIDDIEAATKRVEELKELATVWKGTSEERARGKFVESLAKMVEEKHRQLLRNVEHDSRQHRIEKKMVESHSEIGESNFQNGFGFMSQLQKLRGAP
ncbi:hypothetical protein BGHDH14_bgh01203 [Blumeria hordei DH14]|uniref:Uncharacterized protein n=1 Tax=Blumeria graminis f. sp. hordei (strain DH14) TaxID=546991 RepID=N1J610_BLUG1|nr:hypothetical protein BGHDH14_bgh01203 [Blumeria hordei DH14]